MAIQKRFIHFKKFSDFNSKKLSANEANTQYTIGVSGAIQSGAPDILYQSYCWIKDTQQQWTHGQLYNGKEASGGEENVQSDWNVTDTSSDAYIKNKPTIPAAVTESTVSGWGFTKNTGTYSKPSAGIPKSDLASAVQTSLGKADTALQSYTEQYKGTIVAEDANIPIDEPWDMSFAVLPNGNISITVNGVSNTFMPATPSGDPMHDIFINVGAEYNDTGEDIVRTSIYGDNIVWKNAHWWLNDLGDITTDEMRDIYLHANITQAAKSSTNMMQGIRTRTNIATWNSLDHGPIRDNQLFGYCSTIKTALLRQADYCWLSNNVSWMFVSCSSLEKIFPRLIATNTTSFNGALDTCKNLKEIRLEQLGANCSFKSSSLLSNASILHMIVNSNKAKTTTITLHADAYNRAMVDDEIVAAISSHTNVTLAKA